VIVVWLYVLLCVCEERLKQATNAQIFSQDARSSSAVTC